MEKLEVQVTNQDMNLASLNDQLNIMHNTRNIDWAVYYMLHHKNYKYISHKVNSLVSKHFLISKLSTISST